MLPDLSGLHTAGLDRDVAHEIVRQALGDLKVDVSVVPFGAKTLKFNPKADEANGIRCEVRTNWYELSRRAAQSVVPRAAPVMQLTLQDFADELSLKIATFVVDRLRERQPTVNGNPTIDKHILLYAIYPTSQLPAYTHIGAPGVVLNPWRGEPSPGCFNYDVAVARNGENLNTIPLKDAVAICEQARTQLPLQWLAESYATAEKRVTRLYGKAPSFKTPPSPNDWNRLADPASQLYTSRYTASLRPHTRNALLRILTTPQEGAPPAERGGALPPKAPFAGPSAGA